MPSQPTAPPHPGCKRYRRRPQRWRTSRGDRPPPGPSSGTGRRSPRSTACRRCPWPRCRSPGGRGRRRRWCMCSQLETRGDGWGGQSHRVACGDGREACVHNACDAASAPNEPPPRKTTTGQIRFSVQTCDVAVMKPTTKSVAFSTVKDRQKHGEKNSPLRRQH